MSVLRVFSAFLLCFFVTGFSIYSVFAQENVTNIEEVSDSDVDFPDESTLDNSSDQPFVPSNSSGTISAPSAIAEPEINDDFFDANDLVPQGEMRSSAPIKVNPRTQPASKYVIVTKNHDAGSKDAQLISAERAMKLGRYDSALQLFDALYEINKRDSRVLMGRAVVLQKLGRFDEAMGVYEKLSKIEPDNLDVKINMLGLLSTRYPSVALRRLLDLHEKNRSNVGLMAQIAIAYANIGDSESALKYLGSAASMEPDNANHLYNMAVIADRSGDFKTAISYYEKALEVDTVHGAGRSIPRDVVYERLAQIR